MFALVSVILLNGESNITSNFPYYRWDPHHLSNIIMIPSFLSFLFRIHWYPLYIVIYNHHIPFNLSIIPSYISTILCQSCYHLHVLIDIFSYLSMMSSLLAFYSMAVYRLARFVIKMDTLITRYASYFILSGVKKNINSDRCWQGQGSAHVLDREALGLKTTLGEWSR